MALELHVEDLPNALQLLVPLYELVSRYCAYNVITANVHFHVMLILSPCTLLSTQ